MKAMWNGVVVAESDDLVEVDGNQYFPADSLHRQHFSDSPTRTTCPWKGVASYYNIKVDDSTNADAAWFYPDPKEKAAAIKDRVAFWKGVEIVP